MEVQVRTTKTKKTKTRKENKEPEETKTKETDKTKNKDKKKTKGNEDPQKRNSSHVRSPTNAFSLFLAQPAVRSRGVGTCRAP